MKKIAQLTKEEKKQLLLGLLGAQTPEDIPAGTLPKIAERCDMDPSAVWRWPQPGLAWPTRKNEKRLWQFFDLTGEEFVEEVQHRIAISFQGVERTGPLPYPYQPEKLRQVYQALGITTDVEFAEQCGLKNPSPYCLGEIQRWKEGLQPIEDWVRWCLHHQHKIHSQFFEEPAMTIERARALVREEQSKGHAPPGEDILPQAIAASLERFQQRIEQKIDEKFDRNNQNISQKISQEMSTQAQGIKTMIAAYIGGDPIVHAQKLGDTATGIVHTVKGKKKKGVA